MRMILLHRVVRKFQSALKRLRAFITGKDKKPVRVKSTGVPGLKLHLGAGPINLEGWVNIDAREAPHIHLVANNFELADFADASLAEIYMCHVLEHFSFAEAEQLLTNFKKKLKPGGILRVSVPDIDHLIAAYQANRNDLELVKMAFMGGQDYEYNFHKSIYNHALLSQLMRSCGYEDPNSWTTEVDFGTDLGDWSNMKFDTPAGKFPVSLNIKAYVSDAD